jgi:ADP-heptose:LPS heptosyltransferase
MRAQSSSRVLVVFPGALGDLVCLVPALRELARRHDEPASLLCKGDLVPLIATARLAAAQPIERREASWLFSAQPPREATAFFGAFSSIESFTGAGVPEVERNLRAWTRGTARVHPFRSSERIHLAVHFLRSIGFEPTLGESLEARLELPAEVRATASRRWRTGRQPLLVMHPGSGSHAKRWSRTGFRRVAERWRLRGGAVIVLLGVAEESEADAWGAEGFQIVSGLDTVDVAALLGVADAYLGNDSGISHLAAAVGARGVTLFGPTDPRCWRPLSKRIRAMALDPWSGVDESAPEDAIHAVERELGSPSTLTR